MKPIRPFARVPVFVALATLILNVLGVATPFWLYVTSKTDVGELKIAQGLFSSCSSIAGASFSCKEINTSHAPAAFITAQAFGVMTVICTGLGLIFDVMFRVRSNSASVGTKTSLSSMAALFARAACITGIVTIATYFDYAHTALDNLSWSFAFFVVGIFLGFVNSFWTVSSHAAYETSAEDLNQNYAPLV